MSSLRWPQTESPRLGSSFALSPGVLLAWSSGYVKTTATMTKTIDALTEIVRNPKHAFRKTEDRPAKAQKHRYERRKIKEFIKLSDWDEQEAT